MNNFKELDIMEMIYSKKDGLMESLDALIEMNA
jgi:hypothetical protein